MLLLLAEHLVQLPIRPNELLRYILFRPLPFEENVGVGEGLGLDRRLDFCAIMLGLQSGGRFQQGCGYVKIAVLAHSDPFLQPVEIRLQRLVLLELQIWVNLLDDRRYRVLPNPLLDALLLEVRNHVVVGQIVKDADWNELSAVYAHRVAPRHFFKNHLLLGVGVLLAAKHQTSLRRNREDRLRYCLDPVPRVIL